MTGARGRAMIRLAPYLLLGGCIDLSFDFEQSSIGLHSDSGRLLITGCLNDGLFGCGDQPESNIRMEVVIDGLRYEVPHRPSRFEIFPQVGFEWTVKSPEDPYVEAAFGGGEWVRVKELPWFDLEVDATGPVRRDRASVPLVFDAFRSASLTVVVETTCSGAQFPISERFTREKADTGGESVGRFDLPLDNALFSGACTHEIAMNQEIVEPNEVDYFVTVGRTVHQVVDSAP